MRKRTAVLFLAAFFSIAAITGCQKKEAEETKEEENQQQLQKEETILMAVGEETVSMEEARAYACFLKHQYEGSIESVIWDYKLEGKEMKTYAVEAMQTLLKQIKILKQEAKKEGIALTDDEIEDARSYAKDYLSGLSDEEKREPGLTEELLTQIYCENILADKVFEISTNDVDTNISDDEVKQITIWYLQVMTEGTNREGKAISMSRAEKKQAKKRAKALLKEAKETEDFPAFAEMNTDSAQTALSCSKAEAPKELADTIFTLKTGELSPLIEGEEGYYIVYCVSDDDEEATAEKKEELIKERQMASFEKKFTQWSAEYDIIISTSLWDEIKF